MLSRPTLITIEMKMDNGYINPYTKEIVQWMHINNYIIYKDSGSDIVFIKSNLVSLINDNRYNVNFELKTF
jgi:hypothetical protein